MALQMVDAMAPFAQAGVVDMAALARHVLQFGFGVKSPEAYLTAPQQQMQQGQPGQQPMQPQELPQGPPQGGPQLPPELMAQLAAGGGAPPMG
jgi:hypothetical protein